MQKESKRIILLGWNIHDIYKKKKKNPWKLSGNSM